MSDNSNFKKLIKPLINTDKNDYYEQLAQYLSEINKVDIYFTRSDVNLFNLKFGSEAPKTADTIAYLVDNDCIFRENEGKKERYAFNRHFLAVLECFKDMRERLNQSIVMIRDKMFDIRKNIKLILNKGESNEDICLYYDSLIQQFAWLKKELMYFIPDIIMLWRNIIEEAKSQSIIESFLTYYENEVYINLSALLQKGVTFSAIIHDNIGHLSDPKGHPYQLYTMYLSHSKRLKNQTAQEYMEAQFSDWLTITDSNIDSAINSAMQISKTKISYLRNRSSALEAKNDKKTSITTLLKLLTNRENRKVKGFIREFVFDLNVPNFVGTKYISPCTFKNLQKSLKSSSAPVDYSFLMGQMLPTKLEAEQIMISSLITPKDICQTILDYSNGASKIKASQLLKNIVEKVGWDPSTIWKWCLIDLNASNFENEVYKVNTVDVILDNKEPTIEDEMFEYRDYNIIIKERSSK